MLNDSVHEMNLLNFFQLDTLPYQDSCITIGNFDGVHLGHQAIIKQMLRSAAKQNRPVLVVTFFPNPSVYFQRTDDHLYLTSPLQKRDYLLSFGVDQVLTFKFDRDFAALSPQRFLTYLHQKLSFQKLVVGWDFALGKNRQGTIPVLEAIGQKIGFSVSVLSAVRNKRQVISSTLIRQLLDRGEVDAAANKLGRFYTLHGQIVHGSDRGSSIGLPTANLSHWPLKKLPAVGVYATFATVSGERRPALTNVGLRPTFETQAKPNVETHILGFDGNIYGKPMALEFVKMIRNEKKFSDVESFLKQIEMDKQTAKRIFSDGQ